MESVSSKKVDLGRRRFIKTGAALGTTAVALSTLGGSAATRIAEAALKKHDDFPVPIAENYRRFPQRNTIFSRGVWDPKVQPVLGSVMQTFGGQQPREEKGWTQLDYALSIAGWSMNDTFATLSQLGAPKTPTYAWDKPVKERRYKFASPEEAAGAVKRAGKFLGASLIGITPYDPRWTYDPLFDMTRNVEFEADFPFEPKSVVVIALEMDYEALTTSPACISDAAVGLGYSRMAEVGYSVATFIRELGYRAFANGNDIALSVPYAVAAGLGEVGRNGMLITPRYGPRVRLCKVFTELELSSDKPITFGVQEFCKSCKRCAEACPSGAIPKDTEPGWDAVCLSNNPGALKWYANLDACLEFWGQNGIACINCVASCPYNKPDMWHHRLTAALSGTPLRPVLSELDDLFGYGDVFDYEAMSAWWHKKG